MGRGANAKEILYGRHKRALTEDSMGLHVSFQGDMSVPVSKRECPEKDWLVCLNGREDSYWLLREDAIIAARSLAELHHLDVIVVDVPSGRKETIYTKSAVN